MSFWQRRVGPLRLLVLLNLLLAAGLAWLWVDEHAVLRSLAWVAPKALSPDITLPANAPGVADAAQFAVILERPLFAPDRRQPPPPTPPAPPPPPDPLADIQIVGVFSGETVGMLARIEGKVRRVKVNDKVGPWTLKSIEGRDITFAQDGKNRKLRLAYARLNAVLPKAATAPTLAPAGSMPPGSLAHARAAAQQSVLDITRERLRRLNEFRVTEGLPPLENLP